MSLVDSHYNKSENRLFLLWLIVVAGFFFWSRLDFSNRIYYFGDGNVVVELIRLILTTHQWDPDWTRLVAIAHPQEELLPLIEIPKEGEHFYHMSAYIIIAAGICKIIYWLGFIQFSIQSILHALNIFFQLVTILLIFRIGERLANRIAGLSAVTFFILLPLTTMEAHYERPETWMCLLVTGIMYSVISFKNNPRFFSLLIGILLGLSIATKLSQLIIGIMPALLFLHLWFSASDTSPQRLKNLLGYCTIITIFLILSILICTPFLFLHIGEIIKSTSALAKFYSTPLYPYALEHYSYTNQFLVLFRYFWLTLGPLWCYFFIFGFTGILNQKNSAWQKTNYSVLLITTIIFLLYFGLQVNFIERNFSPVEGLISVISALGVFQVLQRLQKIKINPIIMSLCFVSLISLTLYTSVKLNFYLIQQYIKHANQPPRVEFQNKLKQDFEGFWIKNVYFSLKITHDLPEKPPKAPRLYQIDDLNEYWTRDYLSLLEKNGFKKVATFCSEFFDLPPNTLTIYHAAAKNHYYVRDDEWPTTLPNNYFKTNCK